MVGRVVRDIQRQEPGWDVARRRRRVRRRHRRRGRGARARWSSATPSTSASAAPCSRATSTRWRRATTSPCRSTATASTSPSTCRRCSKPCRPPAPRPTWSTAPASAATPATRCRSGGALGNLIFSVVLTAITRQRITDPTSGFRMVNRRGIELFARDYPHDYPEVEAILMLNAHHLRIHEVDVRMNARGFGQQLDRLPALRLLHGQGPAGDLRRPPAPPARRRWRGRRSTSRSIRRRRPSAATAGAGRAEGGAIVSAAGRRRSAPSATSACRRRSSPSSARVLFLILVIELVRRRRLVERYALLWIAAAILLVVLSVWDGGLRVIADGLGILSPSTPSSCSGSATVFALALHFSVAFSRLSEETKILAQEVARLDGEQRRLRGTLNANGGAAERRLAADGQLRRATHRRSRSVPSSSARRSGPGARTSARRAGRAARAGARARPRLSGASSSRSALQRRRLAPGRGGGRPSAVSSSR